MLRIKLKPNKMTLNLSMSYPEFTRYWGWEVTNLPYNISGTVFKKSMVVDPPVNTTLNFWAVPMLGNKKYYDFHAEVRLASFFEYGPNPIMKQTFPEWAQQPRIT